MVNFSNSQLTTEQKLQAIPLETSSFYKNDALLFASTKDIQVIKTMLQDNYPQYSLLLTDYGISEEVEMQMYKKQLHSLNQLFTLNFNVSIFFGYFKLKEQEIKNICAISEGIHLGQPPEERLKSCTIL